MTEVAEALLRPPFANLVGGEWVDSLSGTTYATINPFRPDDAIGEFPLSGREDVDRAVAAAVASCSSWADTPIQQRGSILETAAELINDRSEYIARDMALEMGKPLREARLEAKRAAQIFRYHAGQAWAAQGQHYQQAGGGTVSTMQRPVGVVGLITPWNFPAAIPAWKLAPALIYGNVVVIKLAQAAPLSGLHLAECLKTAGLPDGVLNVVIGPGVEAGRALLENSEVKALSFTGSVAVGTEAREIATRQGKRVQLELGGQNPVLVLPDADLGRAVEATFAGAYFSAGQKCTATRRIYVHEKAYDLFKETLLDRIANAVVGDPLDPNTEVGPLVNGRQVEDVLESIARGCADGTLLTGGTRAGDDSNIILPTLFEDIPDDAHLTCEEVFGPVATLYRFSDLGEAIERANAVRFGLAAGLFTSKLDAVHEFARRIEAGIIHINSQTAGAEVHVPFGGLKGSGFGPHEQGQSAREFYTETVTLYEDA